MASNNKNLSTPELDQLEKLENVKIGIVTAEWNHDITFAMREGCVNELKKYGCDDDDLLSINVPGAFELPSGAKLLLSNNKLDAVICIGCVIKGETKHDEYISNKGVEAAHSAIKMIHLVSAVKKLDKKKIGF